MDWLTSKVLANQLTTKKVLHVRHMPVYINTFTFRHWLHLVLLTYLPMWKLTVCKWFTA